MGCVPEHPSGSTFSSKVDDALAAAAATSPRHESVPARLAGFCFESQTVRIAFVSSRKSEEAKQREAREREAKERDADAREAKERAAKEAKEREAKERDEKKPESK